MTIAASTDDNLKVYDQLCQSYRAIDDFRARLLTMLPVLSGIGMAVLARGGQADPVFLAAAGWFGALITLGLFAFEIFGIKKCAALIEAGRALEKAVGATFGQFATRPQNIAALINEPFASGIIYPSVLAAWTYFALAFSRPELIPWVPAAALVLGFAGTVAFDVALRRTREHAQLA